MAKKRLRKKKMLQKREQEKPKMSIEEAAFVLGEYMLEHDEVIMFIEKQLNFSTRTIDVRLNAQKIDIQIPVKNMEGVLQ